MTSVAQLTPAQVTTETSARVLDVREPDEVATGAIAGSTNIPSVSCLPAGASWTAPRRSSRCARAGVAARRPLSSSRLLVTRSATSMVA